MGQVLRRQRREAALIDREGKATPALDRRIAEKAPAGGYLNLPKTTAGLEVGKCYSTSSGFTVPARTEGDICSVYNNSGSAITLTQDSGLTLRVAGTGTTGNYSLPQRGLVTIWWHTASEAIIL